MPQCCEVKPIFSVNRSVSEGKTRQKKKKKNFLYAEELLLIWILIFRANHIVSRWDRLLVFAACNLGAAACFVVCFFLFPILATKPRKFAVL